LGAHLQRLRESAAIHGIDVPYSSDELAEACRTVIRENELRSAYVRPLVWLGVGELGTDPSDLPVEAMVAAVELGTYHGARALESGIDVAVSSRQRPAKNTIPTMAKAGGVYLSSQLISREARRNGYKEGIALDTEGNVSEAAASNAFLVRHGVVMTPPLSAAILPGITRDTVITLARELGFEVREESIQREALYTAEEVFLTGTAAEITPVRSVDRRPVGSGRPGAVTAAIQQAFFGLFTGQTADRWGWLEPVDVAAMARHAS
jgi:branched-chain amino acid aminotransferase